MKRQESHATDDTDGFAQSLQRFYRNGESCAGDVLAQIAPLAGVGGCRPKTGEGEAEELFGSV